MNEVVHAFFNVEIIQAVWPSLLHGLLNTFLLSAVVVPLGFILGLFVAVGGRSKVALLRYTIIAYIDFFRSFPPLVLLILVFYGLPFLGLRIDAFVAAVITLVLNSSSYYAEVQRTGLESVPKGQAEAALSTGLSYRATYVFVILPQALRNVLPPLTGNTVEVIKTTAIASAVSYGEMLRAAKEAQSLAFSPTPLVLAALLYFVMLWPAIRLVSRYERTMMGKA